MVLFEPVAIDAVPASISAILAQLPPATIYDGPVVNPDIVIRLLEVCRLPADVVVVKDEDSSRKRKAATGQSRKFFVATLCKTKHLCCFQRYQTRAKPKSMLRATSTVPDKPPKCANCNKKTRLSVFFIAFGILCNGIGNDLRGAAVL